MESTSTEEGLLMREIQDLPVVNSLSFIQMRDCLCEFLARIQQDDDSD
jgi:hypothetical protein